MAPPLLPGARPEPVVSRTWDEEWVLVRCHGCGRQDYWPQPELGCPCGALLRIPVRPVEPAPPDEAVPPAPREVPRATAPEPDVPPVPPSHIPLPRTARAGRPSFRPVAIHTARDAVAVTERYLRWLGFSEVRRQSQAAGVGGPGGPFDGEAVGLRGPGLIARVDPAPDPVDLRAVECLWLNGLTAPAATACFALGGYADDARDRADELGVPLFVLDRAGGPRPVNGPAADLVSASGG